MKKYQLLFKISAVFSYLFFVFGLSQLTLIVQKLLAIFFSDRQFILDSKYLEFTFYWSHDCGSC
ncbi:metal-dependent CAAX amino terminal membrane protease [Streptococcus pneumoniae]|nr:metal-dependent CAAX amino terminal membrane protease [Streptococcus pneumoniae]